MKIIDQTPYYTEKGELSLLDRARAMLKYGNSWVGEMEAQKSVIAVLDRTLDKNFTLLRNVTLAELDMLIPFILLGPSGVYVIYVTALTGTVRAKTDQWGTIFGSSFKPLKPNLLVRTEHMARAVQVYLQRHGFNSPTGVEPVLLCADPSLNVDSLRPITRIVMRDALERFAISLQQARTAFTPEALRGMVDCILTPPKPPAPTPVPGEKAARGKAKPDAAPGRVAASSRSTANAPASVETSASAAVGPFVAGSWSATPAPTVPGPLAAAPGKADSAGGGLPPPAGSTGLERPAPAAAPSANGQVPVPAGMPSGSENLEVPDFFKEIDEAMQASGPQEASSPRRARMNRRQWILLAIAFIIELLLLAVFAVLVLTSLHP
jgi:hypothetical protein